MAIPDQDPGVAENILLALKTQCEAITHANLYRTDVQSVEWSNKDWGEAPRTSTLPWVGIVPQEEDFVQRAGKVIESAWQIDIIAHLKIDDSPPTMLRALAASNDFLMDLRRRLLNTNSAQLGVAGVHRVSLRRRQTNLGSLEAFRQGVTTSVFRIVVKYEEATDSGEVVT
jgi:hypothetical protein